MSMSLLNLCKGKGEEDGKIERVPPKSKSNLIRHIPT